MQDFRLVVTDTEELLRATAGVAGEKVSAARERIQENLAVCQGAPCQCRGGFCRQDQGGGEGDR